jgi:hypothetical protein
MLKRSRSRNSLTEPNALSQGEFDRKRMIPYCPHHPSNTCWWWKSACPVCAIIYRTQTGESDVNAVAMSDFNPADFHPDYRFGQWLSVAAFSASRDRMLPDANSIYQHHETKRCSNRIQQRLPRKGSDTNPSTFTGKVLSIKREGLSAIGRSIEGSKTINSSGESWKCFSNSLRRSIHNPCSMYDEARGAGSAILRSDDRAFSPPPRNERAE